MAILRVLAAFYANALTVSVLCRVGRLILCSLARSLAINRRPVRCEMSRRMSSVVRDRSQRTDRLLEKTQSNKHLQLADVVLSR